MSTLATMVVKLVGDIDGFTKSMKNAEDEAKKSGGGIASALNSGLSGIGTVAKVAAGAAVAGIAAVTAASIGGIKAFNDWAQTLDSIGDVLGTTADESAALAVAIQGVGGDVESITAQMSKLTQGLIDNKGELGESGKLLKKLGVSFQGVNGKMLPSSKILENIANKISKMPDGLEKTAIMVDLFGKSGKDLSDTLNALADGGLERAAQKAEALGLMIGEDGVASSIEFGKSMETLKMALQGVLVTIGKELMPIILPLIQKFAEWAVEVMPKLRAAFESVFNWIKTNVAPILQVVGEAIGKLFQGDFAGALETFKPLWDQFWGTLVPAALGKFTEAFGSLWSAFWSDTVPRAWESFKMLFQIGWDAFWGDLVPRAFVTFTQAFRIVWDQFWGTIAPRGWLAFRQLFKIGWDQFWGTTVPAAFTAFAQAFKIVWDRWWGGTVPAAWNSFKMLFQIAWDTFWGTTLPNAVKKTLDWFGTLPAKFVDIGKQIMTGLWNGIKSMFENIGKGLSDFFQNTINDIKNKLGIQSPSKVFEGIGINLMAGLAQGIRNGAALPQLALDNVALNAAMSGTGLNSGAAGAVSNISNTTYNVTTDRYGIEVLLDRQRRAQQAAFERRM